MLGYLLCIIFAIPINCGIPEKIAEKRVKKLIDEGMYRDHQLVPDSVQKEYNVEVSFLRKHRVKLVLGAALSGILTYLGYNWMSTNHIIGSNDSFIATNFPSVIDHNKSLTKPSSTTYITKLVGNITSIPSNRAQITNKLGQMHYESNKSARTKVICITIVIGTLLLIISFILIISTTNNKSNSRIFNTIEHETHNTNPNHHFNSYRLNYKLID